MKVKTVVKCCIATSIVGSLVPPGYSQSELDRAGAMTSRIDAPRVLFDSRKTISPNSPPRTIVSRCLPCASVAVPLSQPMPAHSSLLRCHRAP